MKPLIIPVTARIGWNTLEDTEMVRDDQECIFISTFDDIKLVNFFIQD